MTHDPEPFFSAAAQSSAAALAPVPGCVGWGSPPRGLTGASARISALVFSGTCPGGSAAAIRADSPRPALGAAVEATTTGAEEGLGAGVGAGVGAGRNGLKSALASAEATKTGAGRLGAATGDSEPASAGVTTGLAPSPPRCVGAVPNDAITTGTARLCSCAVAIMGKTEAQPLASSASRVRFNSFRPWRTLFPRIAWPTHVLCCRDNVGTDTHLSLPLPTTTMDG